jgi:hypothetical protein
MPRTGDDERQHLPRPILLIEPGRGSGSDCGRCAQRAASWRIRERDGVERPLCVYCASLLAPMEPGEMN